MDREELIAKAEKQAGDYFNVGLNCAECTFKGFLDLGVSDFPPETVALASGFGGGIGNTGNTCGAVLGGCLAIATMKGRKNPLEGEDMHERVQKLNDPDTGVYQNFARFINQWMDEHGTIKCSELTKALADEFGMASVERKRFCKKLIKNAAALSTKIALE